MKRKLKFEFTDHAKIQMVFRKVSEGQVMNCVLNPDTVEPDRYDSAVSIAIRETSPETFLKVWYRLEEGEAVVTTCVVITLRRERTETKTKAKKKAKRGKR